MSTENDSDGRDWSDVQELVQQRRKMGTKNEYRQDRITLAESSIDPAEEVVISRTWNSTEHKFHLTHSCHHLKSEARDIEVRALHDDWEMCWWCQRNVYEP